MENISAMATVRSPAYVPIEVVSAASPIHTVPAGTVTQRYMDQEKMRTATDGSGILADHPWLHQHPWGNDIHGHGQGFFLGWDTLSTDGDGYRWGREINPDMPRLMHHGRPELGRHASRSPPGDRTRCMARPNDIDWYLSRYMLQYGSTSVRCDGLHRRSAEAFSGLRS